mmetsp:Transcript_5387/g.11911  ORF Transcript_5387/g.11911 Transcript_5387/m.11911 type:complete len:97 (+) Transcript_5387:1394-1684(+)
MMKLVRTGHMETRQSQQSYRIRSCPVLGFLSCPPSSCRQEQETNLFVNRLFASKWKAEKVRPHISCNGSNDFLNRHRNNNDAMTRHEMTLTHQEVS